MRLIYRVLPGLLTLVLSAGAQASMPVNNISETTLTIRLNALLASPGVLPDDVVRTVSLHTTPEQMAMLCASPELSIKGNDKRLTGRRTVLARCGKRHVYLPAEIHANGTYWKASRDLPGGQIIQRSDIEPDTGPLDGKPAGLTFMPEQIVGQRLTRAVSAGTPVLLNYLRKQWKLRAGQQVDVVTSGQGFRIRSQGRALNNAAVDEKVKIKTSAGRIVIGTVDKDGRVLVLLQE